MDYHGLRGRGAFLLDEIDISLHLPSAWKQRLVYDIISNEVFFSDGVNWIPCVYHPAPLPHGLPSIIVHYSETTSLTASDIGRPVSYYYNTGSGVGEWVLADGNEKDYLPMGLLYDWVDANDYYIILAGHMNRVSGLTRGRYYSAGTDTTVDVDGTPTTPSNRGDLVYADISPVTYYDYTKIIGYATHEDCMLVFPYTALKNKIGGILIQPDTVISYTENTLALLESNHPAAGEDEGTYAEVTDDPTPSNNGYYSVVSSTWTLETYPSIDPNYEYDTTIGVTERACGDLWARLIDSAPEILDTVKEIADAINNDPDFFLSVYHRPAGETVYKYRLLSLRDTYNTSTMPIAGPDYKILTATQLLGTSSSPYYINSPSDTDITNNDPDTIIPTWSKMDDILQDVIHETGNAANKYRIPIYPDTFSASDKKYLDDYFYYLTKTVDRLYGRNTSSPYYENGPTYSPTLETDGARIIPTLDYTENTYLKGDLTFQIQRDFVLYGKFINKLYNRGGSGATDFILWNLGSLFQWRIAYSCYIENIWSGARVVSGTTATYKLYNVTKAEDLTTPINAEVYTGGVMNNYIGSIVPGKTIDPGDRIEIMRTSAASDTDTNEDLTISVLFRLTLP